MTTELAGTISMRAATPADFSAAGLSAPVRGTGSVIDLTVPVDPDAR